MNRAYIRPNMNDEGNKDDHNGGINWGVVQ